MSVIGREGLGFKYEDCVRTSALIHMYAKCKFLNIDEDITSITLGVAKLGVTTDDILIETDNNMIFMQAKSEITGLSDKQFVEAVKNAYTDHLNDLNNKSTDKAVFYYIIAKRISSGLFNSSKIALNNVHGCSSEQYFKIKKEKQEIDFINNLKKITNCNDDNLIYSFMKKLMIIEKSTDLEYRIETDIPILTYIFPNNKDPIKCFKLLYAEIGHLKQKNTEITFSIASKVFGSINLNKKNYAVDLFHNKINFFIDFVNHMNIDFQNFHILTSKIIDLKYEIEIIDKTYLNHINILTKIIFERFVKIIIAIDKDIKILNDLININNIDKIEKIYLNENTTIESKESVNLTKCLKSLLLADISYTNHIYNDVNIPVEIIKKGNKLNILLADDLSFYKNNKYITIVKSFINLLKEFNKPDGFFSALVSIHSFEKESLYDLKKYESVEYEPSHIKNFMHSLAINKNREKLIIRNKSINNFIIEFDDSHIKSFIHRIARNHFVELTILKSIIHKEDDHFLENAANSLYAIREKYNLFTKTIRELLEHYNYKKGKKYKLDYLDYLVRFVEIEKHNDKYDLVNYFFKYIYYVYFKYSREKDINKNTVHSFLTKHQNIEDSVLKKILLYFLLGYVK